jgi:hypothetical protein
VIYKEDKRTREVAWEEREKLETGKEQGEGRRVGGQRGGVEMRVERGLGTRDGTERKEG